MLEKLKLSSIPLTSKLWEGHFSARLSWIRNLSSLFVEGCDGLRFLCSSSLAMNFMHLKNLKICRCHNMVEIISTEEKMGNIFPKLEFLDLKGLGSLEKFCTSASNIEFPYLKSLFIKDCTKLESFILDDTTSKDTINTAVHHLFDGKVSSLYFLLISNLTYN